MDLIQKDLHEISPEASIEPLMAELEDLNEILQSNLRKLQTLWDQDGWNPGVQAYHELVHFSISWRPCFETIRSNTINNSRLEPISSFAEDMLETLDSVDVLLEVAEKIIENPKYMPPGRPFADILPDEVLCHIFELLVISEFRSFSIDDYEEDDDSEQELLLPKYPYILSKVCKSWHHIVHTSPILWSYIQLVVSGSHSDKFYEYASKSVKHPSDALLFV